MYVSLVSFGFHFILMSDSTSAILSFGDEDGNSEPNNQTLNSGDWDDDRRIRISDPIFGSGG